MTPRRCSDPVYAAVAPSTSERMPRISTQLGIAGFLEAASRGVSSGDYWVARSTSDHLAMLRRLGLSVRHDVAAGLLLPDVLR